MLLHWSNRDSVEGIFKLIFRSLQRESFLRTKFSGELICHQSTKDTCVITFSTDLLSSTIIHHQSRHFTWDKTKTKRLWHHLISWRQKLVKSSVDHKEKRDWKFWRQSWISWDYQKRITGGIWSWENSEQFLMEVLVWDLRDSLWWQLELRTSETLPVSQELQETLNSDSWLYSYL